MARQRRPDEPSSYQPQPEIPPELKQRFDVIRAVIGDRMTITRAAEELGIARVNMQTLVHRVEAAMVAALQPKTLATMHGSVYVGDGENVLRDLATVFREVLGAA